MTYYPEGTLEITTAKICSVNCAPICPQEAFRTAFDGMAPLQMAGTSVRPKRDILTLDGFKRAISTVPTSVRINFAGFSEPYMNAEASDMLEYAHDRGHPIDLYTTLRGATLDDVDRIARLKTGLLVLHTPDNRGIAHLPATDLYLQVLYAALSKLRLTGIARMSPEFGFEDNERAGNCDHAKPFHVTGPFYCTRLKPAQFVMLPDAEVVLCCMDWRLKHRIGNLHRDTWAQLLDSPERKRILVNAYGFDGDVLCRTCRFATSVKSFVPKPANARAFAQLANDVAERIGFKLGE